MHEIFGTGSSVIARIFRYLIGLNEQSGIDRSPQSLLAIILSIQVSRKHLARACHYWSTLLSSNPTLSLALLHLSVFGCRGTATEIYARYTVLKDFDRAACNLEASLCKCTIIGFLTLPWRLRVARLDKIFHRSDRLSREIFGGELARVKNFFPSQTVALVERAIAEFSADTNIPTGWPPVAQRHFDAFYTQYELLNFRQGQLHGVAPDEFIARFNDVEVYPWRNLHSVHGSCWSVKAVVQLSSVLSLSPQIDDKVKGTCFFHFGNQSFGATIRIFLGSTLLLTCDFVSIPPTSLDV